VSITRPAIRHERRWPVELAGLVGASAIAITVIVHLISTPRAWIVYYDGDSLVNTLIWKSLVDGQPQHWAMSSVLFVPEFALYATLSFLGLSVKATLTLNAIVNLLALYAAIRFVASTGRGQRWDVAASIGAFGIFGILAMLDSSTNRESFELPSLMATTTYYSATVIGVLVAIGLVRRLCDRGHLTARRREVIALFAVATVSTFTNPIFVAWAVAPLVLLLLALWRGRIVRVGALAAAGLSLALGVGAGVALRLPFAALISDSGVNYVEPGRLEGSLSYYGRLIAERAQTVDGACSLAVAGVLIAISVAASVIAVRRRWVAGSIVSSAAWVVPVVVSVGAVLLGTEATRYLEPVFFAPILVVTVLPGLLSPRRLRIPRPLRIGRRLRIGRPKRFVAGAAVIAAVVASGVVGIPRLVTESESVDPAVQCVDNWVTASHLTGAGQYWTIRAPKAYLADPRQLVQVDASLGPYTWLVNRADYTGARVSFLVVNTTQPLKLPDRQAQQTPHTTISCGRYTIVDYASATLTLGPPRI
jgi:hypothetical protein